MNAALNFPSHTRTITSANLPRLSNEELLRLSREGNQEATHCLVSRYLNVIHGVAGRMAPRRQDAADLVSEIYLRVCEKIDRCNSVETLPGWIKKIAINVFYGSCRRNKRHAAASLEQLVEVAGDAVLPMVEEADPARVVHTELDSQERSRRVRQAIASLSEDHRQLCEMFYFQQHSYEEIAEETGLTLGTIKSRLFRAREALQRKLADLAA